MLCEVLPVYISLKFSRSLGCESQCKILQGVVVGLLELPMKAMA